MATDMNMETAKQMDSKMFTKRENFETGYNGSHIFNEYFVS